MKLNPLEWFKPQRRARYTRTYKAGTTDRFDVNWTTTPASIDSILYQQLRTLRARSREQCTNNEYAKKFLMMLKNHVIGSSGVEMQSQHADESVRAAIEAAWRQWTMADNCDIAGRQSLHALAKLAICTIAKDGEALIRNRRGTGNGPFQFRIGLVDSELLPVRLFRRNGDRSVIAFGIEYVDERPRRYHVLKRLEQPSLINIQDYYLAAAQRGEFELVDASNMMHLFLVEDVGQRRGIPWFSVPLRSMRQLSAFSDAALTNAREAASKMGFISMANPQDMVADQVDAVSGEKFMDSEPGEWHILPEGANVQAYDPHYPSNEYDPFHKSMLRRIASGLGASYNTLANDLEGVNFSSMRHGAHEEREVYKDLQQYMIESFYMPIFNQWLKVQLVAGTIRVDGIALDSRREMEFMNVKWLPRRWAWVDPVSEARANEIGIRMGWTTVSQVIRDSGREPEEVMRERANDLQTMADLGYPVDIDALTDDDEPPTLELAG